jgi:hypothetical protein
MNKPTFLHDLPAYFKISDSLNEICKFHNFIYPLNISEILYIFYIFASF